MQVHGECGRVWYPRRVFRMAGSALLIALGGLSVVGLAHGGFVDECGAKTSCEECLMEVSGARDGAL